MSIRFDKFYNGIGRSAYDMGGFDTIVGCDTRSNLGLIKSSLALEKESGSTVTELCKVVAVDTDANSYWFSNSSGKIWKRTSAGVWSLANTNANGACDGAIYYNDYIYYVSGNKVGRYDLASTWNDSVHTLTYSAADAPMAVQNLTLYIGNSRLVASVNSSGTFTANALDLPKGQVIKSLAAYENDLIIGTMVASSVNRCGVYRWDTYSDSWTVEDYLDENGVWTFIKADNALFFQAGRAGNVYQYNGVLSEKLMTLRDNGNSLSFGIAPWAYANFNGDSLYASTRGIYSIARKDPSFPYSQVISYVPSEGQSTTIGAIAVVGSTVLYSWQNSTSYGVDALGSNRTNGFFITPIATGNYQKVVVKYAALPTGTSISISTKVDGGDWTAQTVITDTINKLCYFDGGLGTVNTLQAKITLTSSTTSTPEVEWVEFV